MALDKDRLWAKSKRAGEPEHLSMFLPQHLKDVHAAAERVLAATADDQLTALGLPPDRYRDRFRRMVLLAAAVHDLGKANDHFQGMLLGTRDVRTYPQGLRHEWVTVLMLRHLREWLLPAVCGNETDFAVVEWAVAGHHPAHDHASPPVETPKGGGAGPEIVLRMNHRDFRAALTELQRAFDLPEPPKLADETREFSGPASVFDELTQWRSTGTRIWRKLKHPPDGRLVAAVKNCLIAADVAGSALKADSGWITTVLAEDRPQPGDLQAVVDHRRGGNPPRAFQTTVADSTARVTFVKAGCGGGKTLAAYMWAAKNHPTRRLYFCYPTTGTATEGFRDYLFDEAEKTPRVGADLFHGRSDVDFDIILNTGRDADPFEEARRLDSLRAWKTPVVACTVDTVLGLVQNNRRGLFGWPALAQAAFVFDEIHAFDDKLFGALVRFLRDLPGLPALLMTASLPKAREDVLREFMDSRGPVAGPANLEERPRYRKAVAEGNDPLPLVTAALGRGEKVLWVCNTVGRVMAAADRLAGRNPLIYHSRFKYEHRVRRHEDVINAFKDKKPAVAICSQVAEMSLDLSADLLVTDLAPVPALIQRLGRLNRRAEDDTPTKPFVVVEPESYAPYIDKQKQPYPANWPDGSRAWLARLPEDRITQKHLADLWEHSAEEEVFPDDSTWLDGGPMTLVGDLRSGSEGVTVLMEADVPRVRARPKDLPRLALPMPPCRGWEGWKRERGLPVAPTGTIQYDRKRGAEWRK